MRQILSRINALEQRFTHKEPINIIRHLIHCACQVSSPEQFEEISREKTEKRTIIDYRMKPGFKCDCHMNN